MQTEELAYMECCIFLETKKAIEAAEKESATTKKAGSSKDKAAAAGSGGAGKANDAEQAKFREEVQRFDWMRAALIRNLRDVSRWALVEGVA